MLPLAAQPLWLPTENLAAGPWEPVCAPVRLASAAASVSFASIPAQYVMFRLRAEIIKDGTNGQAILRLNNDSAGNYARQMLHSADTTVNSARVTAQTSINVNNNIGAGLSATLDIVIAKPIAGAAGLVLYSQGYMDSAGTPVINLDHIAGIWSNTADLINRIDVLSDTTNFAAGSIFILEGSKF